MAPTSHAFPKYCTRVQESAIDTISFHMGFAGLKHSEIKAKQHLEFIKYGQTVETNVSVEDIGLKSLFKKNKSRTIQTKTVMDADLDIIVKYGPADRGLDESVRIYQTFVESLSASHSSAPAGDSAPSMQEDFKHFLQSIGE
ncbi:hypothetical protein I302_109075 [Kwoniella bestiolae CBS 10118]|uniref:Uncharacterized protein n=1 Tax=Kwoniella bestiolae CBS 10118 TaxID=1296100 RepID=A0A1B9FUW9_9TREE|nr:hypothetical protein I302_08219 [Kwoniella bestiolae CBS 10118]OCF22569.1 hypothetical protein I302_08219 [Kwoniella bestiolae CBS 10118]